MKKVFILGVILMIGLFYPIIAENWTTSVDVSLSMNQNSYSDNWHGEEKSNINWVFNANLLAEKQLSAKVNNTNTLKLAFGQTHNQIVNEDSVVVWDIPQKTTDQIDFESMFRFTLDTFVDPFAAFRLESQFLDRSVDGESKIFNPMTLTESFGVARVWIKEEKRELTSRLGGALKEYLNSHENIDNTSDGGIEFVTDYRTPLANDRITFNSKLNVYKAMYYSEADAVEGTDFEDAWKAPRINWENIFSASLTKLINVNLYIQMLYDERVSDEMQLKQTLALGLTYKLI